MLSLPLLVVVFVALLITYFYLSAKQRPKWFPPGPPRLPFWGSYWFMLKENYNHPHLALEILAIRYKTNILGLYLGDTPTVVTLTNDLCKELLTRDEFTGRNDTIVTRSRGLGELKGIFFIDGPLWREQRRFSLRHLRDYGFGRRSVLVEDFLAGEIKYLIELLHNDPSEDDSDFCRAKGQVMMPDFLYGPLLNCILLVLASRRYTNSQLRKVANAGFRFLKSGDVTGRALSITPWLRHIAPDFFGYTGIIESNNYLLNFLREIIDDHIQTYSADHHRDFIDDYIGKKLNLNGINDWDYNQLLLTVLDYLFPAAMALGHTLQFYFASVINNPQVQVKIQQEIDQVVGKSRYPTLDDRKSMPYTEASLREGVRIIPLNPLGIPRRCTRDTTLGGYFIPKDTIMLPNIWTAHRDEAIWENTEKFLPERFLDEAGNLMKKDHTLGFGAGKRLCAGETFARQNMFLIVTAILQNFTLKSPSGNPIDMENLVPGVILSLKENWMQAVPRDSITTNN